MPIYQYICPECDNQFTHYSLIENYQPEVECTKCSTMAGRDWENDLGLAAAVIPKTLGSFAEKQSAALSADQKAEMKYKQNRYKYEVVEDKPLPAGMKRLKKEDLGKDFGFHKKKKGKK